MSETIGYVHSVESFGAVDGPGVRFVVFTQGCPLRCLFCHNPDTWKMNEGNQMTATELFSQIKTYKNFIKKGGVTFSGGEPLLQPDFIYEVIKLCKQEGIHTAIDTSGAVPLSTCKHVIEACDLVMLDIKDIDKDDCIKLTGQSNTNAMAILNHCDYIGKPVWIRHVLVPQYTYNTDKLERLAKVLSWYSCIEKIEVIPFHKMGEYKWDYVDTPYQLNDVPSATPEQVKTAKEIFKQHGLPL
jgi:pyruvate formate lyase activating enzyme